jgi:PIN domain nuclease of toxin-antitoxin system
MRILLDTHVFLWYVAGDSRLPPDLRFAIESFENHVFLSPVSLWETTVKYQLGKLQIPEPPESYFPKNRAIHLIDELPLDEASVMHLPELPAVHRDPFDRMLLCQAIEHKLVIATVDDAVRQHGVPVL